MAKLIRIKPELTLDRSTFLCYNSSISFKESYMFTRSEDVTKALLDGEVTLKSIRNRASHHRIKGNVPAVMMFLEGIEYFLQVDKFERDISK